MLFTIIESYRVPEQAKINQTSYEAYGILRSVWTINQFKPFGFLGPRQPSQNKYPIWIYILIICFCFKSMSRFTNIRGRWKLSGWETTFTANYTSNVRLIKKNRVSFNSLLNATAKALFDPTPIGSYRLSVLHLF